MKIRETSIQLKFPMIFLSVVCYFLSVFNVIDADCAPGDVKNTQENCVHVENLAALVFFLNFA